MDLATRLYKAIKGNNEASVRLLLVAGAPLVDPSFSISHQSCGWRRVQQRTQAVVEEGCNHNKQQLSMPGWQWNEVDRPRAGGNSTQLHSSAGAALLADV